MYGRSDYTVYSDNRLRHRRSGYKTNKTYEADSPLFIKVLYYIKASPPADSEAIGEIFIA